MPSTSCERAERPHLRGRVCRGCAWTGRGVPRDMLCSSWGTADARGEQRGRGGCPGPAHRLGLRAHRARDQHDDYLADPDADDRIGAAGPSRGGGDRPPPSGTRPELAHRSRGPGGAARDGSRGARRPDAPGGTRGQGAGVGASLAADLRSRAPSSDDNGDPYSSCRAPDLLDAVAGTDRSLHRHDAAGRPPRHERRIPTGLRRASANELQVVDDGRPRPSGGVVVLRPVTYHSMTTRPHVPVSRRTHAEDEPLLTWGD